MSDEITANAEIVGLATELTVAWLANPNTRVSGDEVPAFLGAMHQTLKDLSTTTPVVETTDTDETFEPAVSVRKSLASPEHILSMIDGKPYKTLRRHLAGHGLTVDDYRKRYNLKADYPMVAQNYSDARRAMAKKIGLGRKPAAPAPTAAETKPKRGRAKVEA